MSGLFRSPLDRPQFSLSSSDDGSPPIIPSLTQLAPGVMRAIQRKEMGMDDEEQSGREPESPEELFAAFASLFAKAGEFPGLQGSILAMLTEMKLAYDREAMVVPPIRPQMPQPLPTNVGAGAPLLASRMPTDQQTMAPMMPQDALSGFLR